MAPVSLSPSDGLEAMPRDVTPVMVPLLVHGIFAMRHYEQEDLDAHLLR